ncbi:MAG TPA: ShlB/FhaC/HecB family hemolysin secretion/activation protein [Terricaulis sp.]|nr:ShlB/FhaC/HecB family hemolysin secretion/activation protein [Terricaulis sp.]
MKSMGQQRAHLLRTSTQLGLWLACMTSAGALAPAALAQTESPSQTRPGVTAAEPSRDAIFVFPANPGQSAPAGAESVRFTLNELIVEGAFEDVSAAGAPRGETNVAEVYAYAARLQQAYLDAGYPLARVIVPAQELDQAGSVRIQVIDGFIQSLDLDGVPELARRRVAQVLTPLVGKRRPTSAELERRLLLAGDTAGLALRSTLTAGSELGGAALVLHGDHDPIAGVLAADNRVSAPYGGFQIAASVALNSPWGGGEQILLTMAGFPDEHFFVDEDARRRYFALGYTTPIGADGAALNAAYDYSSTRPGGNVKALRLESEYQRFGVGFSYPLVRTRETNLFASANFDLVRETQDTAITGTPVPLSEDRLSVLRLGLDASSRVGQGFGSLSVELSQGLDVLNARSADDATPLKPLSRQGADAEFTSVEIEGGLNAPVASNVSFYAGASGQYAFNEALLRSEQFSPIGPNGISGPPPSAMVGDRGWAARVEMRFPERSDHFFATPYLFGAAAETYFERPTALERSRTEAQAFGAGVRLQSAPDAHGRSAFAFGIELSTLNSNDASFSDGWASINLAVRF